ncbi:MAG: DUF424 domain-containing protein [Candidatus Altiarchaeales archaeon]|nr:MAG: DUF424 domain-containing protein [Candidatus Altiarchaeales archaeon]RLI95605.1 MAG: DUF424 domain-containing protein [Candidatus Altiarchaeales archaeon]HDO82056.1 DUF424 domain-containing protein [Candidatus Altiarchaeales archaeon]HEX54705.1 DUF424 domain-containing protein [Candidatus Altiarchaeales archaeon]
MRIYVKIYNYQGEIILAACDEEILGKSFFEGELKLEVSEGFYKGNLVDIDELDNLLENATIANLSGNNVVERAAELGFIDVDNILEIDGIKHAQMVVMF